MPQKIIPLNKNQTCRLRLILLCVLSLMFFQNTARADTDVSYYSSSPLDFSLSFSHSYLDLKKNDVRYTLNQRRISANLYDLSNPAFHTGLILGSSYLSMDNDLPTEGLLLNGYHIGIAINAFTNGNPRLGLRGYYLFQETKGSSNLRSVTINWNEWLLEGLLHISTSIHWGINLAAGMSGVDVERSVNGDINDTIRLKPDIGFQGEAGIEFRPDPTGRISLVISRGIYDGTRLIFARTF